MQPVPFERNPSNRYVVWPAPEMVAFGALVRRGRRLGGLTQQQVADRSGVSQAVISRFERGLAPGMSVERLVRIALVIGISLPLGFCPHDHLCPWSEGQPKRRLLPGAARSD